MALRKIISFIFPQGANLTVSLRASFKDSFNLDLLHFFDFNDQQSLLKKSFFYPSGDSLADNGNLNPTCGGLYSMANSLKASFYCKPRKTGRYVNIRLKGRRMFLTLCEVEVYSESRGISEFNLLIQLSEELLM